MSRLFRRPTRVFHDGEEEDPTTSAFSALLDSDDAVSPAQQSQPSMRRQDSTQQQQRHRRTLSSPRISGERPQPRKLVKDPSGSARPSFSVEIGEGDGTTGGTKRRPVGLGAELVRRSVERLKVLYGKREK
ncbi:hypothetical protein NKR23_g1793 [Pleurostoma richardsiae]|uniref:Uncharacterized protein n=1 Tax=Pleurostoma richardsiae TaxID=41990 RepID=A0AA38S3R0_9PEZI|nr:hypothetical protein NKR23_g1793 [Pleurostoma richardsiae]